MGMPGPRLKGEPHADDFERVCEKHRRDAGKRPSEESADRGLLAWVGDEEMPNLLIRHEFYGGVGEDAEKCGGVATEEADDAVGVPDLADGGEDARPAARVLDELRVGCLEEDFDAVERRDEGFSLEEERERLVLTREKAGMGEGGGSHSASGCSASERAAGHVVQALLVVLGFWLRKGGSAGLGNPRGGYRGHAGIVAGVMRTAGGVGT